MATAEQINTYLNNILYAQSVYMDDIMNRERLGYSDIFIYRLRAYILDCYIQIMVSYFYQSGYDSDNFFTTTEVRDIIDRINAMCDSHYDIDL